MKTLWNFVVVLAVCASVTACGAARHVNIDPDKAKPAQTDAERVMELHAEIDKLELKHAEPLTQIKSCLEPEFTDGVKLERLSNVTHGKAILVVRWFDSLSSQICGLEINAYRSVMAPRMIDHFYPKKNENAPDHKWVLTGVILITLTDGNRQTAFAETRPIALHPVGDGIEIDCFACEAGGR